MSSSSRATGWRPSALTGAVVCLCGAPRVQLFAIAGNGRPHYHQLMPISCHFRDRKALLFESTHVSSAIASTQTLTFCQNCIGFSFLHHCRISALIHLPPRQSSQPRDAVFCRSRPTLGSLSQGSRTRGSQLFCVLLCSSVKLLNILVTTVKILLVFLLTSIPWWCNLSNNCSLTSCLKLYTNNNNTRSTEQYLCCCHHDLMSHCEGSPSSRLEYKAAPDVD